MLPFKFNSEIVESSSGAKIQLYSSLAANPVGVVQINHGLAEHAARYQEFAEALSQNGFHAYAHDHRGHGGTTAPDAPSGMFAPQDGAKKVLADVEHVRQLIAARHPNLPVIAFGHSMGGLIALNHAIQYPANTAGLAVWNANFSAGALGKLAQGILKFERFRLGHDVPSRMLPKLTFGAWAKTIKQRRTNFDWLSRDETRVDAYIADPLCGWDASVAMWQDVFDFIFVGADNKNLVKLPIGLPLHIHGSAQDPATDFAKATEALASRFQTLGFNKVTVTIDPQSRHESLNEINRTEVADDFIVWAKQALASWQKT